MLIILCEFFLQILIISFFGYEIVLFTYHSIFIYYYYLIDSEVFIQGIQYNDPHDF